MTVNTNIVNDVRQLFIPDESIDELTQMFLNELNERLRNSENSMLPSGIIRKSIGKNKENNIYASIDFGGTTLKLAILSLDTHSQDFRIIYQSYLEVSSKRVDWAFFRTLVFWICEHLNEQCGFANSLNFLISTTFSFPLDSKNRIASMGKGFELMDEIKDIPLNNILKTLFNEYKAVDSLYENSHFIICDIINDSVAVYLTGKFTSLNSNISLILGTGINTCFEISSSRLPAFKKIYSDSSPQQKVLINSEAGFLGTNFISMLEFDIQKENTDLYMPMEFISSGKYLPVSFLKLLNHYHIPIRHEGQLDGTTFGEIIKGESDIISSQFKDLCKKLALVFLERASIYVVAMLEAIYSFIGDDLEQCTYPISIGYVGSFLSHIEEYKNMIETYSNQKFKLIFLEDSNLKGATISTCTNSGHH